MVLPMYRCHVNGTRALFLVIQKHSFETLLTLANLELAMCLPIFETWINVCVLLNDLSFMIDLPKILFVSNLYSLFKTGMCLDSFLLETQCSMYFLKIGFWAYPITLWTLETTQPTLKKIVKALFLQHTYLHYANRLLIFFLKNAVKLILYED